MAVPEFVETVAAAALEASPEVAVLTGDRIYPLKLPQGATLPALVYQRTESKPQGALDGYASEAVTLTVNSFALDYSTAKALALAVRETMSEPPLSAVFSGDQDMQVEGVDAFCVSAKFICQQYGGFCK